MPRFDDEVSAASQAGDRNLGDNRGRGEGDAGFGAPLGLEEFAPLIPFLEAFYRRVHEAIDYPADFAHARIEGKVWVRLSVDGRGVWNDEYLKVESDHAWLRAYVLGALLRVLREPLEERNWARGKWAEQKPVRIAMLFDFKTYEDRKPIDDTPKYVGTALTFPRRAHVTPLIFEKLEQLMEFIPPVLPLNGGFLIDFVRLYRMVESFSGPTELELRNERLKLFKEKARGLL